MQVKRKRYYRSKFFKVLVFNVLIMMTFLLLIILRSLPKVPDRDDDTSCHDILTSDDLVQFQEDISDIESVGLNAAGRRNIYFHETSCRGDLTPRQACTVESAARTHPNWTIFVLFAGPVSKDNVESDKSVLSRISLPNVKLRRVFLEEYVKFTPLEYLISKRKLERSYYPVSHTSDVFRFATLYMYPGVYLDLDIIVTRPLDSLSSNFVIRESELAVAAGALAFGGDPVGRGFARAVAMELGATFDGSDWGANGPGLITRVLEKWCGTPDVLQMNENTCKGLSVYEPFYAYPIHWKQAEKYFEPGQLLSSTETEHAYMYHVWGKFSKSLIPSKDSPYHELAMKYCPTVYKAFKSEFGGTDDTTRKANG